MDKPVELIALVCPQCATPLPAEVDEVAWVCANCGKGLLLDPEQGLVSLEVHYAADIPEQARGKPYWVVQGRVQVERESYGFGSSNAQARDFWSQPRRFFIPAYASPIETILAEGIRTLAQPPALNPGNAHNFEPVVLALEDVRTLVEFIIVAVEAGRKDKLKQLKYTLELTQSELWVLP
jgi:hypothetical protein